MSMFNKIRNRNRKAEKEDEARAAECKAAIEAVLTSFNCEMAPVLLTTPHGILPDIRIYPRELPKHEPGKPNAQLGAAGATVTGKASTEAQGGAQTKEVPAQP